MDCLQKEKNYDIPIVLIIFNRPALAEKQLKVLEKIRPEKLYLIADGARKNIADEVENVARTRNVFESISWNCDVTRLYAEQNMGCDRRIVSGLNKVFTEEEMAVILEDDCIPHLSFFTYCRELLNRYKDDPEIMYISGTKWVAGYKMLYSYGFSYNTGTWGWATWQRAWKEWHWDRQEWEEKKQDWLKGIYTRKFRKGWIKDMEKYFQTDSVPWDYVWRFCVGSRLSIFPAENLIENCGFGENATHTKDYMDGYTGATAGLGEMKIPREVKADLRYPLAIERQYSTPLYRRIVRKIKSLFYNLKIRE